MTLQDVVALFVLGALVSTLLWLGAVFQHTSERTLEATLVVALFCAMGILGCAALYFLGAGQ